MKITYEDHLRDRGEMPVFDESIFYPERELYKLGMSDDDIECIVQFFKWHLEQRNRRLDRQHVILTGFQTSLNLMTSLSAAEALF